MMIFRSPFVTDWSVYPNFSEAEFACECCGKAFMDPKLVGALQTMRTAKGHPIIVNSGYRCEKHNDSIGGSPRHPSGKAADISMAAFRYRDAAVYALEIFDGVGLNIKGPASSRFIHVDFYAKGFWTY